MSYLLKQFHNHKLENIQSVENFKNSIENERLRVDRSGHAFSLITIDISILNNEVSTSRIIEMAKSRIRKIDIIGWYATGQIGIILPYTSKKGAYKLSANLLNQINGINPNLYFNIHTYPSKLNYDVLGRVYKLKRKNHQRVKNGH